MQGIAIFCGFKRKGKRNGKGGKRKTEKGNRKQRKTGKQKTCMCVYVCVMRIRA